MSWLKNFWRGFTEPLPLSPKEGAAMSSKCELPQNPDLNHTRVDQIDLSKRYDIYCAERTEQIVVYRNAMFKKVGKLYQTDRFDVFSQFIEIEQSNGQVVFITRSSVIKFCEPGQTLTNEPAGSAS